MRNFACTLLISGCAVGMVGANESATTLENLEKLVKTKSCKGCDLSGLSLNRLDLTDADLEGADLSLAKLSLTNLSRANLRNANLRGAVFGGTDLSDADLRGADLRGTSLASSYHQGAQFDGQFIAAKSHDDVAGIEVEKEIFVADSVKPKATPETRVASVGKRQDFGESAPTSSKIKSEDLAEKLQKSKKKDQNSPAASLSPAPLVKKVSPVQQAIVDIPVQEEKIPAISGGSVVPPKEETIKEPTIELARTEPAKKNDQQSGTVTSPVKPPKEAQVEVDKESQQISQKTPIKAPKTMNLPEEKKALESRAGTVNQKPIVVRTKEDNLKILLDKKKCVGCDLSGLDLAGKNLDSADLEKADLTGCNLEKADLDKANLKGALLLRANLRQARLKNADLYKADLTGADLTGANVQGAMFDSAQTASAVGLKEAIEATAK